MSAKAEANLLRIFISEADRWEGRPLYEAIVRAAREAGLAGATVLRGVEGFGINSRIHTVKVAHLADNLPMIVEIIDEQACIQRFLPVLDKMVAEGMVTLEKINVILYRQRGDAPTPPKTAAQATDDDLELDTSDNFVRTEASPEFAEATDAARRIIVRAKVEASQSRHVFIDSVHVLLALRAEAGELLTGVLHDLDIDPDTVEESLRGEVTREQPSHEYLAALDAKSRSEANWLGQQTVGAEHLLLGLCETRPSAATDILMRLGVQPREVCRVVLARLGHEDEWQRWMADHPDM